MSAAAKAVQSVPAPDTVDFDLDAFRASQKESVKASFTFRAGGKIWEVPPNEDWPIDVPDLLAEGKVSQAMRLLVPGFDTTGLRLGDLHSILDAAAKFYGLGNAGN